MQLEFLPYNIRMLTQEARNRLAVVLVGARNPQNIGAAARALQDFGFSDLRVVNEFAPPFEAAQLEAKSAVGAADVMRSARLYASLPEAIGDCTFIVGTTAIGGRDLRQPVIPLRDATPRILAQIAAEHSFSAAFGSQDPGEIEAASEGRAALLFGSEKTGLTNEQLAHCDLLLTIPLFAPKGRHLSMNLGQAVAVCLYELSREGFEGSRELPQIHTIPASSADRERLAALLLETMEASDYARRFPANARPEIVRQLAGALTNSQDEAAAWMGFFRLVLRGLKSHPAHGGETEKGL